MTTLRASQVLDELRAKADPGRAAFLQHFFRTGKGEYGEGDRFLGVTVPDSRRIAARYRELPLPQITRLLDNRFHEARFIAVAIMVRRFERGDAVVRRRIFDHYLAHRDRINQWDLVDVSARQVVGEYLVGRDAGLLRSLAGSASLWDRRIAAIASWAFTRRGDTAVTLDLARRLLHDRHDLIHKAVGWMLREVGKVDESALLGFLDRHSRKMPRVMLRYAAERLPPALRRKYIVIRKVSRRLSP